jgi:argininosuccinate synthase
MRLRDSLSTKFAESIYYGFWFAPEFEILKSMIDQTQQVVSGDVRLKLYKGNTTITGRRSPNTLYRERVVTFEDDAGAYDQHDAEGFIKLQALRLRLRNME